jgi:A/G-specific adenine glycosylase
LPAPRQQRVLPQRKATWLVLVSGARVLLERRAPRGLWGGLWTFPEPEGADLKAHCRRALGCEIAGVRKLAPIEHGFTHFRLHAQPVLCAVRGRALGAQDPGRKWLALGDARHAALPTPVRRVLRDLLPG